MKGKEHRESPPGYCTGPEAAERLGMSRQNFHQSGLAEALDRWVVGPGGDSATRLYQRVDVDRLAQWLMVRQGLIALGHLPGNAPLSPTEEQWSAAVEEAWWDAGCPRCGGYAVGEPLEDRRVWCPKCGLVEVEEEE